MLSGLLLENFKAFGKRQFIPFAPITLIFGTNSAGKSTIVQALTLLKQSVDDLHSGASIVTRGNLADLGNFFDLVFQHDVRRQIEITPFLDLRSREWLQRTIPREVAGTAAVGSRFRYDEDNRTVMISEIPVYLDDTSSPAYRLVPRSRPPKRKKRSSDASSLYVGEIPSGHKVWSDVFDRVSMSAVEEARQDLIEARKALIAGRPRLRLRSRDFEYAKHIDVVRVLTELDEHEPIDSKAWKSEYLALCTKYVDRFEEYTHQEFLEDIRAYSNARQVLLRGFIPYLDDLTGTEKIASAIAVDGDLSDRQGLRAMANARGWDWLPDLSHIATVLAAELRRELTDAEYIGPIREFPERLYTASGVAANSVGKTGQWLPDVLYRRDDLLGETNKRLDEFGVPYQVRIDPFGERVEDVFRLRLQDARTDTTVSLLDVGFGVSQVLPVIVQSMFSKNEIIIIEQPEIHVHPRLQSELGTLFQRCVEEPYQNQFIVETHSEHIMRRIQTHVRRGDLLPEQVSVIYVTRDDKGSIARRLRLDHNGKFRDPWPEGFFEEAFDELFRDDEPR